MPEVAAALVAYLILLAVIDSDVLARNHSPRSEVVQRRVAGDSQDPSGERHVPRLVLPYDRDQLDKDVLRDVLGLVVILNEAADVSQDIVCVADIEEVQSLHVSILGATNCRPDGPAVAIPCL